MRRLLTRRWILTHLAVVIVVATCAALGLWQLRRLEERRDRNAALTAGLERAPRPLEEVLGSGDAAYRRATVRGAYDGEREYTLLGRSMEGTVGNHVLTPLYPEEGGPGLIVDRGWVPDPAAGVPRADDSPPAGAVEVTGILLPSEEGGTVGVGRAVARPNTALIGEDLGRRMLPVYLLLRSQSPPQAGPLPLPAPMPEPEEGPHLAYAVQWFLFGAVAIGGWAALVRRDVRRPRRRSGTSTAPGTGPPATSPDPAPR